MASSPLPPSSPPLWSPCPSPVQLRPHELAPVTPASVYLTPRSIHCQQHKLNESNLPPISSDDLIRSPNVIGTSYERSAISRQKGQVKRDFPRAIQP